MGKRPSFKPEMNYLYDDLMTRTGEEVLSCSELRVSMVILRRMMTTLHPWVLFSLSELKQASGLSRQGVYRGLEEAKNRGSIVTQETEKGYLYHFCAVTQIDCSHLAQAEPNVTAQETETEQKESENVTDLDCSEQASDVTEIDCSELADVTESYNDVTLRYNDVTLRYTPSLLIKKRTNKPKQTRARDAHSVGEPPPDFERFWEVWPKHERKRNKGDAQKAWRVIDPTPEQAQEIIDAVEKQKNGRAWRKEGGAFIPLPGTWLRAQGWKDEVLPWSAAREYYGTPNGQRSLDVVEGMREREARGEPAIQRRLPPRRLDHASSG